MLFVSAQCGNCEVRKPCKVKDKQISFCKTRCRRVHPYRERYVVKFQSYFRICQHSLNVIKTRTFDILSMLSFGF